MACEILSLSKLLRMVCIQWIIEGKIDLGIIFGPSADTQGQMNAGIQGQMSSGSQGEMSSGSQGEMSAGNQGLMSSGSQGQMSTGSQGQMTLTLNYPHILNNLTEDTGEKIIETLSSAATNIFRDAIRDLLPPISIDISNFHICNSLV